MLLPEFERSKKPTISFLGGVLSVMELMLAEKISQEQVDTLLSAQPSSSAGEQTFSSVALMSANAQRLIELAVRAGVKPTPALFYPVIQGATKDVKEQITNELQEAGVLPRTESEDVWAVEAINNPDPSHIRIVNAETGYSLTTSIVIQDGIGSSSDSV